MAQPDFKAMQQESTMPPSKTYVPIWAEELRDREFISYSNSYTSRIYFDLFDELISPARYSVN